MSAKTIIWYGAQPSPGVEHRLDERGFALNLNPQNIDNPLLSVTAIAVFDLENNSDIFDPYVKIRDLINHGVRIIIVCSKEQQKKIIAHLHNSVCNKFPWQEEIIFIQNFLGTNFDNFIDLPSVYKWRGIPVRQEEYKERLNSEESILIVRAFPNAEELHVTPLSPGFSGSKVLLVYERRREKSIANWGQPRLVKFGSREDLQKEVGYMRAVAPFVPFQLRPNLDIYVSGFSRSAFVADFVEKSESMLSAAQAGRAEAAISNLFNRTLFRWRDRAMENPLARGSPAATAERMNIISPSKIHSDYRENERIENRGFDFENLWGYLKSIEFPHRVASIHGDLHGENVRVRGDDAILIDFGSVLGADNGDAPLCFDVAMLEVALVFAPTSIDNVREGQFRDDDWERNIRPYYKLDAIKRTPKRETLPNPTSWIFDCIHRIRAFGNYDQTDPDEYAVALVVALWRWCKWEAKSSHEKGRRVVALEIGAEIIMQIKESRNESKSFA
jgi:hypothetical protein